MGDLTGLASNMLEAKRARELDIRKFNSDLDLQTQKQNAEYYREWVYNWESIFKNLIDYVTSGAKWLGDSFIKLLSLFGRESVDLFKFFLTLIAYAIKWILTFLFECIQVIAVWIFKLLQIIIKGMEVLLPIILFLLKWIFFLIFIFLVLYTLYYLIWFGMLPPFADMFGSSSSRSGQRVYTTQNYYYFYGDPNNQQAANNDEPQKQNPLAQTFDSFLYSINTMISSVYQIFGEAIPPIVVPRHIHNGGRCNEVTNIAYGNSCVDTTRIKDIVWNLDGRSADYNKLPEALKNKKHESITIPYVESNGYYVPDCNNSYYTETKERTGLIENLDGRTCRYVPTGGVAYVGNLMRTGLKIDSYASMQ